jgi:hypothetical protein
MDESHTYSTIGLAALALGELFETFGLVAHEALDFDERFTSTPTTVDGLSAAARSLDLPAEICELFGRVSGLH